MAVEKEANLVTLEATGGVESALAAECAPSRMAAVVVNQRQVKDFARAGQACENGRDRRSGESAPGQLVSIIGQYLHQLCCLLRQDRIWKQA